MLKVSRSVISSNGRNWWKTSFDGGSYIEIEPLDDSPVLVSSYGAKCWKLTTWPVYARDGRTEFTMQEHESVYNALDLALFHAARKMDTQVAYGTFFSGRKPRPPRIVKRRTTA